MSHSLSLRPSPQIGSIQASPSLNAETRTGETWRTIRAELGQIRQGHFQSADGEFTQTSELTAHQRALHTALAVSEPPRLGRITPAATPQPA